MEGGRTPETRVAGFPAPPDKGCPPWPSMRPGVTSEHMSNRERQPNVSTAEIIDRLTALEASDRAKDVEIAALKADADWLKVEVIRLRSRSSTSPPPPLDDGVEWITRKEAVFRSGRSESEIRKLEDKGVIRSEMIGTRVVLDAASLPPVRKNR